MSASVALMVSPCSSITGVLPYAWCSAKLLVVSTLMAVMQLVLILGLLFVILMVAVYCKKVRKK